MKNNNNIWKTIGVVVTIGIAATGWSFGIIQKAYADGLEKFDIRIEKLETSIGTVPVLKAEINNIKEDLKEAKEERKKINDKLDYIIKEMK
jgi:hypothetical protein